MEHRELLTKAAAWIHGSVSDERFANCRGYKQSFFDPKLTYELVLLQKRVRCQ